jgi:serine/threonine protein kinase
LGKRHGKARESLSWLELSNDAPLNFENGCQMALHEDLEEYSLLKLIGRGAFGNVFLAKRKSDRQSIAVKIIREVERASKIERSTMQTLRHPFIVSTHGSFISKQKMHICMELVRGGTLYQRLTSKGPLPLSEAKLYISEIALALKFLHDRNIIYRDLKPENVMLGLDGHVKLTDFGLSAECARSSMTCGTPDYMAPEMVAELSYGKEVDWWALGILIYEMLFRRTPFYAVDRTRMNERILNRPVVLPQRGIGTEVSSLIYGLLEKDPHYRFGFEDIVKDPLMADLDFSDVAERKITPLYFPKEFISGSLSLYAKKLGSHGDSFQIGDGLVKQPESVSLARASMVVPVHSTHIKSLS